MGRDGEGLMPEELDAQESMVTPEMVERKGIWGDTRTSYPVATSDIRRWAIAVYWPDRPPPIFWDDAYAAATAWGGIIAPQDFNPFAWPVERPTVVERRAEGHRGNRSRMRVMNGGQTDIYGVPIRPGDAISSRTRLRDWEERKTRLGNTLFVFNETEWTNQHDELVKRRVSTGIRYQTQGD
ncbi:MAG: FAS1-like dehydratase domain-containing protein [Acidimicrobiales bacterium]